MDTAPPVAAADPAGQTETETQTQTPRVVLVSIDGVRWQDFFDGDGAFADPESRPLWSQFWARLAPRGVVFGDRARNNSRVAVAAARPISLPVYRTLMAGFDTGCLDNDCPRIDTETLPEAVRRRLDLSREQVAVFASWAPLARAVASHPDRIEIDVPTEFDGGQPNRDAPPWQHARWDAETFERAMAHLKRWRPRFLYLALNDPDEWAHRGDRPRYLEAQRRADVWLAELADELDDATTLLVTTDHGRGEGSFWKSHGRHESARDVFLAAVGPGIEARGSIAASRPLRHTDLRPTIERLLGLEPSPCDHPTCGEVIAELVPSR